MMKTLTFLVCCSGAWAATCDADQHRVFRPTYEAVRSAAVTGAQKELAACQSRLDDMQARVVLAEPGVGNHSYAVKPEDMLLLRYMVSQLKANPAYELRKVSMKRHRLWVWLELNFGKYGELHLQDGRTTYPGDTSFDMNRCFYMLPTEELSRALRDITVRALPEGTIVHWPVGVR